jgi:very-short-patch-repair endonuclease
MAISYGRAERLACHPQLPRRAAIKEALLMAGDGVESVLEEAYESRVGRAHRLPRPVRQVVLSARSRSDAVYDRFGLVVELDGRLGHDGPDAFRDADRDNEHAVDGWVTLRFGWYDVIHRPCRVAGVVVRAMRSRGWRGRGRQCRLCG